MKIHITIIRSRSAVQLVIWPKTLVHYGQICLLSALKNSMFKNRCSQQPSSLWQQQQHTLGCRSVLCEHIRPLLFRGSVLKQAAADHSSAMRAGCFGADLNPLISSSGSFLALDASSGKISPCGKLQLPELSWCSNRGGGNRRVATSPCVGVKVQHAQTDTHRHGPVR